MQKLVFILILSLTSQVYSMDSPPEEAERQLCLVRVAYENTRRKIQDDREEAIRRRFILMATETR